MAETLQVSKTVRTLATIILSISAGVFAAGQFSGKSNAVAAQGDDHESRIRALASADVALQRELLDLKGDVKAQQAALTMLLAGQAKIETAIVELAREVRSR